ncbi:hypothetical protein NW762_014502 [Fusarium torreyae]|uniref:Uncharacterized protein n=1 Tax=Fusarium torreyae TaxID=1237075 RepID=A0A9W8V9B3_9HYPO|nr:hypothetical protein NW762_014502 [Fusarium torreyae]
MGSKTPSKRKKKSKFSPEDSPKFEVRPFSDFGTSPAQDPHRNQDSDHSWMDSYLVPESRTCNRPMTEIKKESLNQEPENVVSLITPQKSQTAPPPQSQRTWEPIANTKSTGTGPHDNHLAQSQGNYREPSLRRGSGATVQTPDNLRKNITKRKEENKWIKEPAGTAAKAQCFAKSQPASFFSDQQHTQGEAASNQYEMTKPREKRGDVHPVGHRKLAAVQKQSTADQTSFTKKPDDKNVKNNQDQCLEKRTLSADRPKTWTNADQMTILETCLDLQDWYVDAKPNEKVFWKAVESRLIIPSGAGAPKIPIWTQLKRIVNKLCRVRRSQLRTGTLVRNSGKTSDMTELIDKWNEAHARQFVSTHRGFFEVAYKLQMEQPQSESEAANNRATMDFQNERSISKREFESTIWPAVKDKILSFAEAKLLEWTETMLAERMEELESLTRPPLLKANSSPESYQLYVNYLTNRTEAAGRNSTSIRKTEAVMSWAMSLEPGLEERLRKQLQHVGDNHDDRSGGHDSDEAGDDDDDIYSATDDNMSYNEDSDAVSDEDEETVLPSIEPRTPIVTPRSMAQLYNYEHKYLEALRAATTHKEAQYRALQDLDSTEHVSKKRKAPEGPAEHGRSPGNLAIRSKKGEPNHQEATANTPTPAPRKRQRLEETLASSPATTSDSSEFPSLQELLSSSIGRASSAITKPSSPPAVPVLSQTTGKNMTPQGVVKNDGLVSNPLVRDSGRKELPSLFVTPDPPVSGRANKQFACKRSISHSASPNVNGIQRGREMPSERFREETAEFQAMTPQSRETMLYQALKELRK